MSEELYPETFSLARAGDESGDILDHESMTLVLHDTEIGNDGREWIVGNLRLDIGDSADECGFTDIRETDDTDIRDEP